MDVHEHTYRPDLSDWWCQDCDTVTDFCTELAPYAPAPARYDDPFAGHWL